MGPFIDRHQAAQALAARLATEALTPPIVVLALPRGGVPIGAVIAQRLGAPLDLLLVRKIGAPWQRELAVAALVDGDPPELVIDEGVCAYAGASRDYVEAEAKVAAVEIARRRQLYLGGRPVVPVTGATAIVVDDGIATGTSMRAALRALRKRAPAQLVLAVPVAPADTLSALAGEVDRIVCLMQPEPFNAVGVHYIDFHQVSDEEVIAALQ